MSASPQLDPAFSFLKGLEALCQCHDEAPTPEDPALCFVCLRWLSDGTECRTKYHCDERQYPQLS
jgi:hypothetical protein